jgi:ketosteroid isomerase-like protein
MQRNAEIEALISEMMRAMRTGDADAATAGLSEELTVAIGTDAEEWWEGYDASAKAFRAQLEASGGLPIDMSDVRGYALEGVGWFESRGSIPVEGQEPAVVRMTGVLRNEPEGWKLVQVHASTGIPNADLGMEGLPV